VVGMDTATVIVTAVIGTALAISTAALFAV
jgi:hypothetical protein